MSRGKKYGVLGGALAALALGASHCSGGSVNFAQCSPGLLNPSLDQELFLDGPVEDTGRVSVGSRLEPYELRAGHLISEGDIVLGSAADLGGGDSKASSTITLKLLLWPGGVVPYTIDSGIPDPSRVTMAIDHWNSMLSGAIRLVPHTSEGDWASFTRSASAGTCASSVGRQGG